MGLIDVELDENSVFTMPDIPMTIVSSFRRQVNVTNRYVDNSNNHPSKHHKLSQAGVMPLPGLELLRPSREQTTRIYENSYHKLKWQNEKARSDRAINV